MLLVLAVYDWTRSLTMAMPVCLAIVGRLAMHVRPNHGLLVMAGCH